MPAYQPTFEVDKEGLAKIMARRGPSFALLELLQNAWDEATTVVTVTLEVQPGNRCLLTVEDDNPAGFADLSHAYRLFAESAKKGEATKRGRFNLGEKLVIAICDYAEVSTTTGRIRFDEKGRRHFDSTRESGSVFTGLLRMTEDEFGEACREMRSVIVPDGVKTIFNGQEIPHRTPLRTFSETLTSEIADPEGNLKRTWRKGTVSIYPVLPGETATIYELGIPVVAIGDRWHVDVGQKVPLNVDRSNVTAAYLQDIRKAVLNHAHDLLDADSAGEGWINDAIEDKDITAEAVKVALDLRFGEQRVAYDPSDKEANGIALSQGYAVVAGRSLSKAAWGNVRRFDALLPAGQVTPSPTPYTPGQANTRSTLPEDDWTENMRVHAAFARRLAERLVGVTDLEIEIVNDQACRNFAATWRASGLTNARLEWNLLVVGRAFFDQPPTSTRQLSLLLHEIGHQKGGHDHLSSKYLDELTRLGADCTRLALVEPALFETATSVAA